MTSLSKKETLAAIGSVKAALLARSAIQELTHLWFDGNYVYATNNGLGIKAKLKTPLKCGVPGALLIGLLDKAGGETLEFQMEDSGLKFKAGRSSVKLATLPFPEVQENGAFGVWRFPEKPSKKPVASLKVSEDFLKGLKKVSALRPSSPTRVEHYSVCIFAVDDEMDLYVTDSKSMLVAPVSDAINGAAKKIALPRMLADVIAAQCKPESELKMYSDHFAIQVNDKVALFSNILDTSEMFDLPSLVEKFSDQKENPSANYPTDLGAALERVVVLAGSDEPTVTLKSLGKVLKLSGKFRYGEIDEEFALNKAITKGLISVDAKALLAAKDIKRIAFAGSKALTLYGDDGFLYILAAKDSPAARAAAGERSQQHEEPSEEDDGSGDEPSPPPRKTKGRTRADLNDDIPF